MNHCASDRYRSSYEYDGSVAYVPVKVYDNGLAVPSGTTFYGDREQTQAYVECLDAKAKAEGDSTRYRRWPHTVA